jgi:exopolyphosphatase/pppGpp-phosphohydrolase
VAEVDTQRQKVTRELFSKTVLHVFGNDARISDAIADTGRDVIAGLLEDTSDLNVGFSAAVATEVFRRAENGQAVIDHYQDACSIPITVISPQQEGALGFGTACALSACSEDLICWDAGAGSFQLSSHTQSHFDAHGSGTVLRAALHEEASAVSPNPVSSTQLAKLLNTLHAELKQMPAWALGASNVLAIGSAHSIFNQQRVLGGKSLFCAADVEAALADAVGLCDRELARLETRRAAELMGVEYVVDSVNAKYVVAKLALLLAVMHRAQDSL